MSTVCYALMPQSVLLAWVNFLHNPDKRPALYSIDIDATWVAVGNVHQTATPSVNAGNYIHGNFHLLLLGIYMMDVYIKIDPKQEVCCHPPTVSVHRGPRQIGLAEEATLVGLNEPTGWK